MVVEKSWQQQLEACGHIASVAKKQKKMYAGPQLTFPFLIQSSIPTCEVVLPTFNVELPCSVN